MGFTDWISKAFNDVVDEGKNIYNSAKDAIGSVIGKAQKFVGTAYDTGTQLLSKAADKAEDVVTTLYNDAKGFADKGFDILGSPFTMIAIGAAALLGLSIVGKMP